MKTFLFRFKDSGEESALSTGNLPLEGMHRNRVAGITDCLDMTLAVVNVKH